MKRLATNFYGMRNSYKSVYPGPGNMEKKITLDDIRNALIRIDGGKFILLESTWKPQKWNFQKKMNFGQKARDESKLHAWILIGRNYDWF